MIWTTAEYDAERARARALFARCHEVHCASPEAARAYLVKLGTHTVDGQLTPEYGGPPFPTRTPG